jgi:hypothetical protein
MALFSSLHGIYEPFYRLRKTIGFDTFEGFLSISPEDGHAVSLGQYSTPQAYQLYLEKLLQLNEQESPIAHLRQFEIIKGDVVEELLSTFMSTRKR